MLNLQKNYENIANYFVDDEATKLEIDTQVVKEVEFFFQMNEWIEKNSTLILIMERNCYVVTVAGVYNFDAVILPIELFHSPNRIRWQLFTQFTFFFQFIAIYFRRKCE